ncbi:MAG: thiamine diphosphokinase [Acidimicrobiales bacterium]
MAAPAASGTIIVVTGGDPVDRAVLGSLPTSAVVIAADSGIGHAQSLGLAIDVAVGDFDSVDPADLARAEQAGALIERHPEAKDATDLELALDVALTRQPERVIVVGGGGGRLDHLLANAVLLASPAYAAVGLVAHMGPATVTVVRREAALSGPPGDVVSLLAVHGAARRVTATGLLYPLHGEDLLPGSTRGVSNELVAAPAVVRLDDGVLLAVQPGHIGTHHLKGTSS